MVQATHGILGVRKAVKSMNEAAENFNRLAPEASRLLETANQFIPQIQIAARFFCDQSNILHQFTKVARASGIGANLVPAYQGVKALHLIAAKLDGISDILATQTTLTAQRNFPNTYTT